MASSAKDKIGITAYIVALSKRMPLFVIVLLFALGMGILSFAGSIGLAPSVILGLTTLIFTALIIGSVYKSSILQGLRRLFVFGYTARAQVCDALINEFDSKADQEKYLDEHDELREYFEDYLQLTALKCHNKLKDQKKIDELELRCRIFEDKVVAYIKGKEDDDSEDFTFLTDKLKRKIRKSISWQRKVIAPAALIISSFAGVSMFATLFGVASGANGAIVSVAALFTLSVGLGAASAGGIIIAAITAIPFAFAIYHTIANVNIHKAIAWKDRFLSYMRNSSISKFQRGSLVVAILATTAIAIIATVFTGSSWWFAALGGASILGIAAIVVKIASVCYALAFFSFSITHSVNSVMRFVKESRNPWNVCRDKLDNYIKENGWGQLFNPFTFIMNLISVPLKMAIFISHNISEALVNVKEIAGSGAIRNTVFITIDDAATEADSIFQKHGHDKIPEGKPSVEAILKGRKMRTFVQQNLPHDHGPLNGMIYVIKVVIFIVLLLHPLAAAWDYLVGNRYRSPDKHRSPMAALKHSWQQFHKLHHHEHNQKDSPQEVELTEISSHHENINNGVAAGNCIVPGLNNHFASGEDSKPRSDIGPDNDSNCLQPGI